MYEESEDILKITNAEYFSQPENMFSLAFGFVAFYPNNQNNTAENGRPDSYISHRHCVPDQACR